MGSDTPASTGNFTPASSRPTYTRDQLTQYITTCIAPHSPSYTLVTLEEEIAHDPIAALSTLQLRHLAANVWGNLALHYSAHRTLSLDPDALFHKIVERRHGGYCMENNAFFATVLRSLGFQLYVVGARVSVGLAGPVDEGVDPGDFLGWQHEVIIVTINGKKYLVDVGFGPSTPLHPIPLDASPDPSPHPSVPGAEVRLIHRPIASNTDTTQKLWVLETRNTTHPEWAAGYCFADVEWLPADFEIINYRVSQDPRSWFTHTLVLVRILVDEETRSRVLGTVILMGESIERRVDGGKKEVVVRATSERERVIALRTWFGIVLRPDEERGILGLASEIHKAPSV